jgi:4'-phosphopantetheinyl transferase
MQLQQAGPAVIAWSTTGSPGQADPSPVAELDPTDRARGDRFDPVRRRDFLLGRSLIARLVREQWPDVAPWSVGSRVCGRCGERHAGVELTGIAAVGGVAYAQGLVVAAVAASGKASRLGVDVERDTLNPARDGDLARLLGPMREPALRRWTRVEAVLKADGRGLLVDPADVGMRRSHATVAGDPTRYRLVDAPGPSGFVISLAWSVGESSAAGAGPATR